MQQMTMLSEPLPAAMVERFAELERAAGLRESTLAPVSVLRDRRGWWWLEVTVDGRHHALLGREDLEGAARDLFTRVHGTLRSRA